MSTNSAAPTALRAREVAALLGISLSHAYRHASQLGGRRIGRRVIYDPAVVDQIRHGRNDQQEEAPRG